MISKSEKVTDFPVRTVRNRETKFLPVGPPPLQSSTKGKLKEERQQSCQSIREELGGLTLCSYLKDKGMQTQYEVNNFSRVTLLSKLNCFSYFP
jgi:hypothetical protein